MIDVRTITDDEVADFVTALRIGFAGRAGEGEAEQFRARIDLPRTIGAFDDGRVVATARAWAADMTVPGGARLDVAAVTSVTVMPTHRRRGLLTEMMRQQLDDVAARGEPVAVLVAAEAPIYGRFGYGPAIWRTTLQLDTARAVLAAPAPERSIEMVDATRLRELAPDIYDRARSARAGTLRRPDTMWDARFGITGTPAQRSQLAPRYQVVTHAADGALDGYLEYEIKNRWEGMRPNGTVVVHELCAATPDAYAALWHYAATQDWCVRLEADDRAVDEALPWLLADQRQVVVRDLTDFVWARVVDVAAALSSRTYSTTDRLVIEVTDDFLPGAGGRFELDGSPEGATCTRTDAAPDLTIAAGELGAGYFGGTPLARAAGAGLVQAHAPDAVARFDRMFVTAPAPWCSTMF